MEHIPNKQIIIEEVPESTTSVEELDSKKNSSGLFLRILIVIGIAVLIIYGVISSFPSIAGSKTVEHLSALDSIVRTKFDEVQKIKDAKDGVDMRIVEQDITEDVTTPPGDLAVIEKISELSTAVSATNTATDSNRQVIVSLGKTVRNIDEAVTMFGVQVNGFEKKLTDSSDLNKQYIEKIAKLERALKKIESDAKATSKRINTMSKQTSKGPPYSLVSIDKWGGVDNVMVEFKGHIEPLMIGDSKSGWTLDKIENHNCVEFSNKNNRNNTTLCIN